MDSQEKKVYTTPLSVAERLAGLSLDEQALTGAAAFALSYALECTSNDPLSMAGLLMWGKTVRALRDEYVPLGWSVGRVRNYDTVVHPDGLLAIAVAAGDTATGQSGATPMTRSDKGPATVQAIAENQLSFADIPGIDSTADWPVATQQPKQTWILLHNINWDAGEVHLELSLPNGMTPDGHISSWTERIILTPFSFDGATASLTPNAGDDEPLDIPVEPKAS